MKTLEDERHVVIKAISVPFLRFGEIFFVLAYIACLSYPYI